MVKIKYVGKQQGEFFIPGIPGVWKKDEVRTITEEEYEKIKNDKNFKKEEIRNITEKEETKHATIK